MRGSGVLNDPEQEWRRTMRPYLAKILSLALLFILTTVLAVAGNNPDNKTETIAKADVSAADPLVKVDAMVKMDPRGNEATKSAILPPPDGHELAESCKAEVEGFDAGYCLGVVEGVIASMKVCKRDRSAITLGEAADATARYLANHPEPLKERDVVLTKKALSKAYPCGSYR
jgi:hypothetical protein